MKIPRIIKHPNYGSLDDVGFIGVQKMSRKRRSVYQKITADAIHKIREQQSKQKHELQLA